MAIQIHFFMQMSQLGLHVTHAIIMYSSEDWKKISNHHCKLV